MALSILSRLYQPLHLAYYVSLVETIVNDLESVLKSTDFLITLFFSWEIGV